MSRSAAYAEPRAAPTARVVPRHLVVLLTGSAVLLTMWSVVVPIFEAPDEDQHWYYARYVHDHWQLPPYEPAFLEANQPPLYYSLIAPLASGTELPRVGGGCPNPESGFGPNCSLFDHSTSDFRRYRPVYAARFATALLSTVTVLFVYLAGYGATGSRSTGLLAAGLVALLPQFTFRGTNISNDAMIATSSAAATYFVIRLIRRGFAAKTALAASVCVATAFLSKISGMVLLPVLVLALVSGQASLLIKAKRLGMLLVVAVCVAPWLIRNQVLYGDPLASSAMLRVVPVLVSKKSLWSSYFATTFFPVLGQSLIGVFGWMNVYLPRPVYWLFAVVGLLGVIGFARSVADRRVGMLLALVLVTVPLLAVVSTVHLNLTFNQAQGRYLFPGLPAFAVLVAIGLEGLPRWNRSATLALLALLGVINVHALLAVELRTYWLR